MSENYAFIADNNFLTALGIPEKILKNINIKYSLVFSRYRRHRLNYLSSDRWRGLYHSFRQWCWPTRWRCLGRDWGSLFPFNSRRTKVFQESNGESRKTALLHISCVLRLSGISYKLHGSTSRTLIHMPCILKQSGTIKSTAELLSAASSHISFVLR